MPGVTAVIELFSPSIKSQQILTVYLLCVELAKPKQSQSKVLFVYKRITALREFEVLVSFVFDSDPF